MATNVYVDGFNLYFGCLKGTPYRWLDLAKLCQLTLPNHTINRIRYFTALVQPRPTDPQQLQRQRAYIRALRTIPNLSVHYGHFLTRPMRMVVAHPSPQGPATVEVIKTEEKGSDVNIATYLLLDGFKNEYDTAVIISNDSDLVEPIKVVRQELKLNVGVLSPNKHLSQALSKAATFYRPIRQGPLSGSQFPATLTDSRGLITKPTTW